MRPREAKDPINGSAGFGEDDNVFRGEESISQSEIVLEKNTNYLSVTSWLAWQGG